MSEEPEPAAGTFRAEARDWLRAHVPAGPQPSVDTAEGFEWHRAWERELAAARLSVVSWPAAYGGRDVSLLDWLAFEDEYYAAAAPVRVGQNGIFLLGPTLLGHGSSEQQARLLPPMARADEIWAQAWSEPDAGSDLAAIRARAERADGGWLLSGTKTWSSRAAFADKAFGLFRCDPAADGDPATARHRGLIYLMFSLRADGVTVRPIRQLGGGTGFAEIFLDEVFVPDADVIGEPGDGWRIAMSTAGHERGLSLRSPGRFTAAADRLTGLWRQAGGPGGHRGRGPGRRRVDRGPGVPAAHLRHRGPARRGRHAGRGGQPGQGVLVRARRGPARDRAGPARPAGRDRRARRPGRALAGWLPVRAGRADLRGHQRDPAHGDRRAAAGPSPVRRPR